MTRSATPFGVYVHIPFCASKCDYCAFATWTDRHHLHDALPRRAASPTSGAPSRRACRSPRACSSAAARRRCSPRPTLGRVLAAIPRDRRAEVTVECNPDDVTAELLRAYVAAGVEPGEPRRAVDGAARARRRSGGTHDRRNVERAVERGARRRHADVQPRPHLRRRRASRSTTGARRSRRSSALDPPHVSAYGAHGRGRARRWPTQPDRHPDDDDQADKYELADDAARRGRPGELRDLATGRGPATSAGTTSCTGSRATTWASAAPRTRHRVGRRWWNVRTPERYIDLVAAGEPTEAAGETLDEPTRRFEGLQLQLRMRDGVPARRARRRRPPRPGRTPRRPLGPHTSGRLMANEISLRLKT